LKLKKEYEIPEVELIYFDVEDVMTSSGDNLIDFTDLLG